MGKRYNLPADKEEWFCEAFHHTENFFLAEELGISIRTVTRLARKRGLRKSRGYRLQRLRENASWANYCNNKAGRPNQYTVDGSKYGFKKGVGNKERYGDREEEIMDKWRTSFQKTIKSEKWRVQHGLPQRTKIRIVPYDSRQKIRQNNYLKHRGYVLDPKNGIAYYTDSTKRCPGIEAEQKFYKFQKQE